MHFLLRAYPRRVRRLLALVSAIIFVDALLFTALTPLVPAYAEEFDLSKAGAGLLVGAYGAGALFGGIPGGLAAARFGPKRAVVGGLVLLSVASFAFAAADSALALGAARFVQGIAEHRDLGRRARVDLGHRSARATRRGDRDGVRRRDLRRGPRARRSAGSPSSSAIGLSFAIVGVADTCASPGSRRSARSAQPESASLAGLGRALRDQRFLGGLWLNMLPAMLFGLLIVLTPLALDDAGWGTFAIAAVFFAAGLVEVVLNPVLGRFSDRVGRLLPDPCGARAASVVVAVGSRCELERRAHRACSCAPRRSASEASTRRACR